MTFLPSLFFPFDTSKTCEEIFSLNFFFVHLERNSDVAAYTPVFHSLKLLPGCCFITLMLACHFPQCQQQHVTMATPHPFTEICIFPLSSTFS